MSSIINSVARIVGRQEYWILRQVAKRSGGGRTVDACVHDYALPIGLLFFVTAAIGLHSGCNTCGPYVWAGGSHQQIQRRQWRSQVLAKHQEPQANQKPRPSNDIRYIARLGNIMYRCGYRIAPRHAHGDPEFSTIVDPAPRSQDRSHKNKRRDPVSCPLGAQK